MGSCNDKLKSRRDSKQSEDQNQSKAPKKSCVNIYDLSGALGGNIEMVSGDAKEMSIRFKLKGNDFYHKKDYKSALDHYTKAIKLYGEDSLYFTNRALVYKQLKLWSQVIEDCELAISKDVQNVKAFNLKGIAFIEQGKQSLFESKKISKGLEFLGNARELTIQKDGKLLPEIKKNISKGRKILFLKEREINGKKIEEIKGFLNIILDSAPDKKNEILRIIDCQASSNQSKLPDHLQSKLEKDFMQNPLITPDGISYEKEALLEHCKSQGGFDPLTRKSFGNQALISNHALKNAVEDFLEKHPWAYESDDVLDYNLVQF